MAEMNNQSLDTGPNYLVHSPLYFSVNLGTEATFDSNCRYLISEAVECFVDFQCFRDHCSAYLNGLCLN